MNTAANKWTEYDFIIAVDASGSMSDYNKGSSGPSRWDVAQETVLAITRQLAQYDDDGIDVVRFGGQVQQYPGTTPDKVKEIFASGPMGTTPTTEALQVCLSLAGKSNKKDFILILTDGEPNDQTSLKKLIVDTANKQQSDEDLTILFIQVGDNAGATKFLQTLDDGLNAKFDIVDVKTVAEVDAIGSVPALLEAALNG